MENEYIKENIERYFTAIINIMKRCLEPDDGLYSKHVDIEKFVSLVRPVTEEYFKNWSPDDVIMDTLAYLSLTKNATFLEFLIEAAKGAEFAPEEEKDGAIILLKKNKIEIMRVVESWKPIVGMKMGGFLEKVKTK